MKNSALIFLFFLLQTSVFPQVGFYKYLYHAKDIQYSQSVYDGYILPKNQYVVKRLGGRNTTFYNQVVYNSLGTELGTLNMQFNYNGSSSNILSGEKSTQVSSKYGVLSGMVANYTDTTILQTISFDQDLNRLFTKDNYLITGGTYDEKFGFFVETTKPNHVFERFNDSGLIKFSIPADSIPDMTKKPVFGYNFERYFVYNNQAIVSRYNLNDSLQISTIDSLGKIVSIGYYIIAGLKDIAFHKNGIFTIEEDTSVWVKFRDFQFNTIRVYNSYFGFQLSFNSCIYNDSSITLHLTNKANYLTYGTQDPPEIHVLDWKGNFIKRRYFRYNETWFGGQTYAPFSPKIIGLNYTENQGYYMALSQGEGTYDHQYGLLKINHNLMCDDTVNFPSIMIIMSRPDSLLSPIDTTAKFVNERVRTEKETLIWPNPVTQNLYISSSLSGQPIEIFNNHGQIILRQHISSNQIDIQFLKQGIYFIKINEQVIRLVKE